MQTDLFQSVATAEIFQIRVIKGATVILSNALIAYEMSVVVQ